MSVTQQSPGSREVHQPPGAAIARAEPVDQGFTAMHGRGARDNRRKLEQDGFNLNIQENILTVRTVVKRVCVVSILRGFQERVRQLLKPHG